MKLFHQKVNININSLNSYISVSKQKRLPNKSSLFAVHGEK